MSEDKLHRVEDKKELEKLPEVTGKTSKNSSNIQKIAKDKEIKESKLPDRSDDLKKISIKEKTAPTSNSLFKKLSDNDVNSGEIAIRWNKSLLDRIKSVGSETEQIGKRINILSKMLKK